MLNASIAEFFGTMILILGILATGDERNLAVRGNVGPLIIGFVVLAVGLSLGGPSSYSINPARDLGRGSWALWLAEGSSPGSTG